MPLPPTQDAIAKAAAKKAAKEASRPRPRLEVVCRVCGSKHGEMVVGDEPGQPPIDEGHFERRESSSCFFGHVGKFDLIPTDVGEEWSYPDGTPFGEHVDNVRRRYLESRGEAFVERKERRQQLRQALRKTERALGLVREEGADNYAACEPADGGIDLRDEFELVEKDIDGKLTRHIKFRDHADQGRLDLAIKLARLDEGEEDQEGVRSVLLERLEAWLEEQAADMTPAQKTKFRKQVRDARQGKTLKELAADLGIKIRRS